MIQSEPLAEYMRESKNLHGIVVEDENKVKREIKGGQYVYDSISMLRDKKEICNCLNVIEEFGEASGSKLNKDKTVGITDNIEKDRFHSIKLTNGPEILLGVPIGNNGCANMFWKEKIVKLKRKMTMWKQRDLSISGKIHVICSIGLSLIAYASRVINIDESYVNDIMNTIWEFLWNGKKCYVSGQVCMLPRLKGGIGMPSVAVLIKVRRRWF